jgi:hypothetical protein
MSLVLPTAAIVFFFLVLILGIDYRSVNIDLWTFDVQICTSNVSVSCSSVPATASASISPKVSAPRAEASNIYGYCELCLTHRFYWLGAWSADLRTFAGRPTELAYLTLQKAAPCP